MMQVRFVQYDDAGPPQRLFIDIGVEAVVADLIETQGSFLSGASPGWSKTVRSTYRPSASTRAAE
jgi:hypothetical protein